MNPTSKVDPAPEARLTMLLPVALREALEREAARNERSLGGQVRAVLREHLGTPPARRPR